MQRLSKLLGPLFGLVLLVCLLLKAHLSRVATFWSQIDYGVLTFGVVIIQASYLLRALRWRFLLIEATPVRFRSLYSALNVGLAANWLLPFRIGEMAAPYSLSKLEPVPFTTAMASVVVDRLFDIFWLAGTLFVALIFLPLPAVVIPAELFGAKVSVSRANMVASGEAMGVLLAGLIAYLVAAYFRQEAIERMLFAIVAPVSRGLAERLARAMRSFAAGLRVLRNGRHLAMAALCTLLHWGLGLAGGYLLLASFPLGAPPAWWQVLLLTVVVGSGLAVLPNAPGNLGTFHLSVVVGLLLWNPNLNLDLAIGFAIVDHLAQFVPAMLLGLFFVWRDGLSLIPKIRPVVAKQPR